MTRHQHTKKQSLSAVSRRRTRPPVLWDRDREHQARLGHRIAELRRTRHA